MSGVVALVLDAHPEYTPDQVKAALANTANQISGTDACVGAGSVSAKATVKGEPGEVYQTHPAATGTGSLEAARGSDHLEYDGVVLNGEQDIFGQAFDSSSNVDRIDLDRIDLDRRRLERIDLDRKHLDRKHLDWEHLDRLDMDRLDMDWVNLDRRLLERIDLDRQHLDREHLDREHLDRFELDRTHLGPRQTHSLTN